MWKLSVRPVSRIFQFHYRSFLSEAYSCRDAWQARLTTPVLAQVNQEALYFDLEQKFQQKGKVSAIDIDIYANKLVDDTHIDEIADIMHKFRLTEETSKALDSTQHAVVRNYIDYSHYSELIEILNNRIGYGVFLDNYTANLTLDRLITTNEFKWAARVATLLALQEDFSDPIALNLALYACYRYVKGGEIDHFDDMPPPVATEQVTSKKKKDEVKIRVKFLRNEYFDDHFDLKDSKLLLGKTFFILGLNTEGVIANSIKLLGLVLHEKYVNVYEYLTSANRKEFNSEIMDLSKSFLDKVENKEAEGYAKLSEAFDELKNTLQISNDSFEKLLLDSTHNAVAANEKKQIEKQTEMYSQWCKIRQERLEEELLRLQRAKRIQEVERLTKDMEKDEQKLWFFENEDKIDLQIDSKKVFYPKRWFGKKKKPRVQDEGYVPPEVRQRGQLQ